MADERIDKQTGFYLSGGAEATESTDRQFRREAQFGRSALRLRRGVFTTTEHWGLLTPRQRYLAEIRAVVATRLSDPVISHQSAAAVWGIPLPDAWPGTVHVLASPDSRARSKNGVTVHRSHVPAGDVVDIDGMLVTSPARTLLDLARTMSFATAVVAIDHALNPRSASPEVFLTETVLREKLQASMSPRGSARALRAIRFGRPNADNPGESLSRVAIFELGFPDPLLQTCHRNPRGGYYFTDFEWPAYRLIGEFDGQGKYLKDEFLRGLTPGEAVTREKIREDDLRSEGNGLARWGPADVRDRRSLLRILTTAGLPILR
ncbi:hypothetical protein E3T28_12110 [Cryobacterium sinapicolor]|uniref:Transcriptional regulator, AbiEi antitoxin, Type IV TA system n=1 Tax=Cryobacterium sinapicolor TaxID=1259236 RepID=A0ABY2IX48_9MICO|nr:MULTISPECIES: hypothetical protein [Cryobacterium]TFC85135.1 hypothetical protein E3O67_12190 [Cryobacterium sp. TMT3-29-2]TFC96579.1 hypothetical protein E3T28_12110 [Cryobacterium sinapicolor]